jgi:arylsulfatase A
MNVLLVVLDSVRAANCSCYGYPRETTPTLGALAGEATVYEQARAPSSWTLPSHVSLFTGLETAAHGVTVHDRLAPGHTVWDRLADEGVDTGLFTENGFLASHPVGLADPFQTVVSVPGDPPEEYVTGRENDGPDGFYYADALLDWADSRGEWAACLNLMDAHRPYEPAPEYDRWGDEDAWTLQSMLPLRWEFSVHGGGYPHWQLRGLETLYDGGIRQADAVLGHVLDGLRERGVYDETLVVVCGDHGEGFGEFGRLPGQPRSVAHIVPTGEELLHVPLVIKRPGQDSGERVADPAALTALPEVVQAVRAGDNATFARERVLASKQPVTGDLRDRYERAVDDPEPLFARSRAVYERDGDAVRKTYSWGDAVGAVRVHRAGVVERVPDLGTPPDDVFESVTDAGVRRERDERVTEETKTQLEALGYF